MRRGELRHEFVRVPVQPDLVAGVADLGHLFREGLDAVGGDEPGGFDVVFVPEFQQAVDTNGGPEDSAGVVGHVGRGAVLCVDPSADGVDVDAVTAEDTGGHLDKGDGKRGTSTGAQMELGISCRSGKTATEV